MRQLFRASGVSNTASAPRSRIIRGLSIAALDALLGLLDLLRVRLSTGAQLSLPGGLDVAVGGEPTKRMLDPTLDPVKRRVPPLLSGIGRHFETLPASEVIPYDDALSPATVGLGPPATVGLGALPAAVGLGALPAARNEVLVDRQGMTVDEALGWPDAARSLENAP